jgi:hypothetical protein
MNKTNHLVMWAVLMLSSSANAQGKYEEDLTILTLAQQCVAEVDFENPSECWVMWHINAELAEKKAERSHEWHLVDQLRAYNSAFKVMTPRTLWVLELNLSGEKPPHWPDAASSWPRMLPRWNAIVGMAREFVDDPGERACPSANAYGGSCLDPKGACDHAPGCWVQVLCHSNRQKPFRQAYYAARRCNRRDSE